MGAQTRRERQKLGNLSRCIGSQPAEELRGQRDYKSIEKSVCTQRRVTSFAQANPRTHTHSRRDWWNNIIIRRAPGTTRDSPAAAARRVDVNSLLTRQKKRHGAGLNYPDVCSLDGGPARAEIRFPWNYTRAYVIRMQNDVAYYPPPPPILHVEKNARARGTREGKTHIKI